MDRRLHRVKRQEAPDLVQGHALLPQYFAWQDGLGPLVEKVVLSEGAVRLVLRARGRWHLERVEHHDDAGDTKYTWFLWVRKLTLSGK